MKKILENPPEFISNNPEKILEALETKLRKSIEIKIIQQNISNKLKNKPLKQQKINLECIYKSSDSEEDEYLEEISEISTKSSVEGENEKTKLKKPKKKLKKQKTGNFFELEAEMSDSDYFDEDNSNNFDEDHQKEFIASENSEEEESNEENRVIKSYKQDLQKIEQEFLKKYKRKRTEEENLQEISSSTESGSMEADNINSDLEHILSDDEEEFEEEDDVVLF